MNTQCTGRPLTLKGLDKREIVVGNDAKVNSRDGGLLLPGKLERRFLELGHEPDDLDSHYSKIK